MICSHIIYRTDFNKPDASVDYFNDLVMAAGLASTYEQADRFDEIDFIPTKATVQLADWITD